MKFSAPFTSNEENSSLHDIAINLRLEINMSFLKNHLIVYKAVCSDWVLRYLDSI